ncbi:hypothetical protein BpHYR1_053198 [Brachionus plicatilis]|uniref:Uncharacterized protein n=1 Tax=Brachionus plicatilis TaxID=10195 RepID=A0A3M7ST80_BRAPC|nr:hypothetical protein BpHYR1_053198 [Brachionus plicatilis]
MLNYKRICLMQLCLKCGKRNAYSGNSFGGIPQLFFHRKLLRLKTCSNLLIDQTIKAILFARPIFTFTTLMISAHLATFKMVPILT